MSLASIPMSWLFFLFENCVLRNKTPVWGSRRSTFTERSEEFTQRGSKKTQRDLHIEERDLWEARRARTFGGTSVYSPIKEKRDLQIEKRDLQIEKRDLQIETCERRDARGHLEARVCTAACGCAPRLSSHFWLLRIFAVPAQIECVLLQLENVCSHDRMCFWLFFLFWLRTFAAPAHFNVYICIHTYVHTRVPLYTHVCTHTSVPTRVSTHGIHIQTSKIHAYLCTYIPKYVRSFVRTYIHTHTHTHTYIHTYMYTHTHTYIQRERERERERENALLRAMIMRRHTNS
jgi:hypothetical protein